MISICRNHSTNVKNWQSGDMALRWCAAGLVEAGKQFRRVNGHMHLPVLRAALQRHVAEQTVGGVGVLERVCRVGVVEAAVVGAELLDGLLGGNRSACDGLVDPGQRGGVGSDRKS